ncbi:synaptic vesicle glycoprotein 2B [Anabrus simplex]|uniref:synaptic vesicle glycoprotein 2B n=1 Tax=Anabrus simplex TaxID=316456 RepID=UPI0035A2F4E3
MPSIHITGADDKEAKATRMSLPTDKGHDHDTSLTEFEEALSLTGHGKFHHLLLLGCGLCLISMISETISTSYLLPAAQCDFDMSSSEKGLLSAVVYIGMICSSHMWGFLADTKGRRKILVFTLFMNSLCNITAGFMPTFWLYFTMRFLNGIFICGPSSVVYAYLGEFHSEKTRTRAMVWVCVYIALGMGIQPGIAWLIIPQKWSLDLPWYTFHSWRVFAMVCGLPSLLTAILLVIFMPESPKFLLAAGREHEAMDVLRHVYAMNSGKEPSHYPVKALKLDAQTIYAAESSSPLAIMKHMWYQTKPIFRPPYILTTVVACFIQFGLYASSNGFLLWIPDLFNRLGQYLILHPNETATVCTAINALNQLTLVDDNAVVPLAENYTQFMIVQQMDATNETAIFPPEYLLENITAIISDVVDGMTHYNIFDNSSDGLPPVSSCNSDVDPLAFQNTLIIGLASAIAYLVVGQLISYIPKKTLLVLLLVASGSSGMGMYFAQTYLQILLLSGCFLVLSGMCVSVVNSVVIDVFPTHLRAMAICMSLMMGRVGTVSSSVLLGVLLDLNCALAIFLLSSIVIGCGLMSLLLP